ncbi:signal transduction histidine kinase [Xylaria intraflava]|nr:signal transduction histidine kinase [Xylaria intraflava]
MPSPNWFFSLHGIILFFCSRKKKGGRSQLASSRPDSTCATASSGCDSLTEPFFVPSPSRLSSLLTSHIANLRPTICQSAYLPILLSAYLPPVNTLLFSSVDSASANINMASNDPNDRGHDGKTLDLGDAIDIPTFSQILDMDETDEREFTKFIVYGYFEQAEETFDQMDEALQKRDLDGLYRLGHFLKGSSATIGLTKVKDSCEKIQRYGKKENTDGTPQPNEERCLSNIRSTLEVVKSEYADGRTILENFLNNSNKPGGRTDKGRDVAGAAH